MIVELASGTLFDMSTPLGKVFIPIFIGIVTIIVANLINILMKKGFKTAERALEKHAANTKDEYHKDKIASEKTKFVFMRRITTGIIYLIGIILLISTIPSLKTFSYSLLAGAGVFAIIIGFATQKTFANIISGLMISISQPFRVGDRVRFQDEYGTVQDITLRHTVLKTWDNRYVIIPNDLINQEVINNYTIGDEKILATVEIDISYDSDIDLARKIMHEEILKHPKYIDNRTDADLLEGKDPVKVRVVGCGDFSVKLRGYYWVANQPDNMISGYELTESIKKRFDKEGVEIPFPYRTVVFKKDIQKPKKLKAGKKTAVKQVRKKASRKTAGKKAKKKKK
ncbi:MAG: mechanosensitive ion channel family protein [Nanoarchaeota archaeon]|nr:mechanosensitive ion channel family protein [Nanoarchaeota archaeon]MBU1321228.1 mechanosensitive ion channel family protein [Nanoarchaeota archaeon]MBU1597033.1 mechanosensitive ion channel family protein [Nanoarchaeota archaeon]MBU2441821.1 mechanosensitive ion channel family protein [Nanoarchaeota archaeon]